MQLILTAIAAVEWKESSLWD